MERVNLPVLKAWKRVFELLECIYKNPYNRVGFQDAVLELYPGKEPKSVFRGMAVPTLRNLGFIIGYGNDIRISSNGHLVYTAFRKELPEGIRALRAVLLEMDSDIGLIKFLEDKSIISVESILYDWIPRIAIRDTRVTNKPEARDQAARERIKDWLSFLSYAELIYYDGHIAKIDLHSFIQAKDDIDYNQPQKIKAFEELFFVSYRKIVVEDQRGIKIVEIENLRRELSFRAYEISYILITERQFDRLLSRFSKTTEKYSITFGRSMGPDEKLFNYQGKYFQTLSIRMYD